MSPLPSRMTVIAIRAPGGPEMLVPEERPVTPPGPGEILVKVAAAGVNRPDVRQRQGTYPPPKGATDIPGLEIAGEVVALGAGRAALASSATRSARWWSAAATRNIAWRMRATRCRCRRRCRWSRRRRSRRRSSPAGRTCSCAPSVKQRRLGAGARRHVGHRHHRDHAGQGVRRQGDHHRGLGGEVRGGEEARRRRRGELQDRGFRRGDQDRRPAARAPT